MVCENAGRAFMNFKDLNAVNDLEPTCLVCSRPLTHHDKWPGEIKGQYVCLRCGLTVSNFWHDGVKGARKCTPCNG